MKWTGSTIIQLGLIIIIFMMPEVSKRNICRQEKDQNQGVQQLHMLAHECTM